MFCPKCGKEIDSKVGVCSCTPKKDNGKKRKALFISIIVLVFCSLLVCINAVSFNGDMEKASKYIQERDFKEAETLLKKQLFINRRNESLYLIYADCFLAQNEFLQAVEILEDGLSSCHANNNIAEKLQKINTEYSSEIIALREKRKEEEKKQLEEQRIKEQQEKEEKRQAELKKKEEEERRKEEERLKAEQTKADYIASCEHMDYSDLARNPDNFKGKALTYTGQIVQVQEPSFGTTVTLRINVTKSKYGSYYSDTIYATVDIPKGADRLLEDDVITIYGDCQGLRSYTTILGAKVSIPEITIRYFELVTNIDE